MVERGVPGLHRVLIWSVIWALANHYAMAGETMTVHFAATESEAGITTSICTTPMAVSTSPATPSAFEPSSSGSAKPRQCTCRRVQELSGLGLETILEQQTGVNNGPADNQGVQKEVAIE